MMIRFFKILFIYLFLRFYLLIFREKGRERDREGEKHQCVVASHAPPTGDLAHNPGMCPDWESNWQPFGSQAGTQSTEPHRPRLHLNFCTHFHVVLCSLNCSIGQEEVH